MHLNPGGSDHKADNHNVSCERIPTALSTSQQMAYALPVIGVMFLVGPMGIVQGIYAKYFGVPLTTIAAVVFIARLFDAATDPAIGYLSDKYRARKGTRKPFVLWGGLLTIVSAYFLFVPVDPDTVDSSTRVSDFYFMIFFLAFYFSYTLFEIPHQSWGTELAASANGKNTIFSWRAGGWQIGALCFYLIPLLPFFDNHAFTPETLQWSVLAGGLLLLPALYFGLKNTPNNRQFGIETQPKSKNVSIDHTLESTSIQFHRKMILNNKPLLFFIYAYFFYAIGCGAFVGLMFIFIDSYLGMGEDYVSATVYGVVVGLVSVLIWRIVMNRYGKIFAWIASKALFAITILLMVGLVPGEASYVNLLIPSLLLGVASIGTTSITPSLLSDIIDYSTWKYKVELTGTYFSLYTFMNKCFMALGVALGLAIVGWYGFEPANPTYTADIAFGIRLSMGWIPISLLLISAIFVGLIPINVRRHAIVRRRLDARARHAENRQRWLLKTKNQNSSAQVKPVSVLCPT